MKKLTIGILAHVDSGKTTLSEALLYTCGIIRKLGRVDHADTFLDTYSLERKRGITIFSKQAKIAGDGFEFTLLDTPGHVDFSPETERTLCVLDMAVLVVSGTDGVQSHTETLFRLLKKHSVPVFIFINKMDVPSADPETLMQGIRKRLSPSCIEADKLENDPDEVSVCDDRLLEKYLESGVIETEDICNSIGNAKLFPCFFGSALKNEGIETLIEGIKKYMPEKTYRDTFGARIYKITHDENGKRLTHLKVTGGKLAVRDSISGISPSGEEWSEKIDGIRLYSGTKFEAVQEVCAGTVCTVTGLSKTFAGDVLGDEKPFDAPILEPVFNYRMILPEKTDPHTVYAKLKAIEEEEPQLRISYEESTGEIKLLLMGQVQLEIIKHIIKERLSICVDFDAGSVVYRETIADTVEGVGHYEPLRHYAEVHLILEPVQRGTGLDFCTDIPTDELDRSWQRLILTHLEEKTHLGVLTGSPITDMKITLVAGKAHKKHTEGGDFREATYRAVRQGLRRAKSILLEPYYNYEIRVPDALIGRVMSDMQRMGAAIEPPESDGEFSTLKGSAAVSKIQHYGITLADFSHGKGQILCTLKGYEECKDADMIIENLGYNPDADIFNSCDSIFCASGAGFLVKWDEVENYMHLPSVLGRDENKINKQLDLKKRAHNYLSKIADDKELMNIFEMTYGPIRRKSEGRIKVEVGDSRPQKPKAQKPSVFDGEEYLLVDGYNIIFAWDELKELAKGSLDLARNELINRLCNYQGFCGTKIILVFDAYKVKKNPGTVEDHRNISVVYTKEAETADSYIQKVSKELSKKHRVRVATSDGPEQLIILGNGALRVPAAAFRKELTDAENAIREIIDFT
ncbi:MAG: GTP-binding protein [Ruminococcaceae bacterium]|nr:GTP-binding protein [Oscillospiraceae bacterium]